MVHQKSASRLSGIGLQTPGTRLLANGIPGPDGIFLAAFDQLYLHADLAIMALDPNPTFILDAHLLAALTIHVQIILRNDLSQPGILTIPGVVHHHRPLVDGEEGIFLFIDTLLLQWLVEIRQRVEVCRQAFTVDGILGTGSIVEPLPGETKPLESLGIELDDDGIRRRIKANSLRQFEILFVGEAIKAHRLGQVILEKALVLDVALPLIGIGLTAQMGFAILTSPTGQETDPWSPLKVGDEVLVAAELGRAIFLGEGRELEPSGQLHHHILPRPHVTIGLEDWVADGVTNGVWLGDRAIEQGNGVVTLEVGGIRQDQVTKIHHFRMEGIDDHQEGDLVLSVLVLGLEHFLHIGRVHGGVPTHVGHEEDQRIDAIGILVHCVGDHHVHQPMVGNGRFPGVGLVDTLWAPFLVNYQVLGGRWKAQRQRLQRSIRRTVLGGLVWRRHRFRVRSLGAETAGAIDGAKKDLQQMNSPRRLHTVGMRGDAAHGVHRHRPTDKLVVLAPCPIGPLRLDFDALLEGDVRHFQG